MTPAELDEIEKRLIKATRNKLVALDVALLDAPRLLARVRELEGLLTRSNEEMKLIWEKDTGAIYDITLRIEIRKALNS
jgi:hypothetical protein